MSPPLPIHYPGRELRTEPHESEPMSSSYDASTNQNRLSPSSSSLLHWEAKEDQFHWRLQQARRSGSGTNHNNSGGSGGSGGSSSGNTNNTATTPSFWRSSSTTSNQPNQNTGGESSSQQQPMEPSFNSMTLRNNNSINNKRGLLGAELQSHNNHYSDAVQPPNTIVDDEADMYWANRRGASGSSHNSNSSHANNSNNNNRDAAKKQRDQQRRTEVRLKRESLENQVEPGHPVAVAVAVPTDNLTAEEETTHNEDDDEVWSQDSTGAPPMVSVVRAGGAGGGGGGYLERGVSDQSTGSVLYGKAPNPSHLAKNSSLIFPTGVENAATAATYHRGTVGDRVSSGVRSGNNSSCHGGGGTSGGTNGGGGGGLHHYFPTTSSSVSNVSHDSNYSSSGNNPSNDAKLRKINLILDQCESNRFPFSHAKKKLILQDLQMTAADIPLRFLCGTSLGNSLHKLCLSKNPLGSIPDALVQASSLPSLKNLELSECRLHALPTGWNLPQLRKLKLSNNFLRDFPDEKMLAGLPELQELDMFGNKIQVLTVPHNTSVLSKLEILDLGFNDLSYLPDELDQLRALRTLKLRNNFLTKIQMRVVDMDLRTLDVAANPVCVPPQETCDRGICSMKRYYQQVRMEDQSRGRSLEQLHRRVARGRGKKEPPSSSTATTTTTTKKKYSGFLKGLSVTKSSPAHKKQQSSLSSPPTAVASAAATIADSSSPNVTFMSPMTSSSPGYDKKLTGDVTPADKTAIESSAAEEPLVEAEVVELEEIKEQEISVNDTLKVIFVGMAMAGKTSMIRRLIYGKNATLPEPDARTVGVDIYAWDPKQDKRFEHIDSRIQFEDKHMAKLCGDVDVKLSVWDFAGQHVYHATHELFFSSNALYVLVWDMGANNKETLRPKKSDMDENGDFKLSYDSESESEGCGDESDGNRGNVFGPEDAARSADRALERDIDEKIQFWVDCIQSSAPGAAILPVASFADFFESDGGMAEAKRRCHMLKERLLRHEQQRIQGIERRLQEYQDQNRADDPSAHRLRNLLCPTNRPKLIFGEGDEDCVVRVSGTHYSGFDLLTEKILSIATGKYRGPWRYPVFHGHIGTRIPRMRLQVRDAVRNMRDRFKVVEWGYFINQIRENYNISSVEDISDALHFLTSVGELSYFGSVMSTNNTSMNRSCRGGNVNPDGPPRSTSTVSEGSAETDDSEKRILGFSMTGRKTSDGDDDYDDEAVLSIDETSITAPGTEEGSISTVEDFMSSGLSQFVFLNPRWLVAAVACILRHDLDREIKDTRRLLEGRQPLDRASSFHDASLNCPVITAEDAMMLWQAKRITKKAAERAQAYSNNMTVTPFEFLQLLLIRFGVFVPIDLSIEKALLGGKEYARLVENIQDSSSITSNNPPSSYPADEVTVELSNDDLALKAKFFFLPSLLGDGEPSETWTFKTSDSWKTTLCHSVLFPDGVPPGLMERLTASVLSSIYAVSNRQPETPLRNSTASKATYEGKLMVREVLCWRTAFFLKLGNVTVEEDGSQKESVVEIFCHLAERDSPLCVGSDYMAAGTRRIIVSGRGQVGDGGRKIWKGGYLLVCKCVTRVMEGYGGLEYEIQAFCPDCLAKKSVNEASWWEFTAIRSAVKNSEGNLRCHHHGHVVDTRFVAGPVDSLQKQHRETIASPHDSDPVSVQEILGGVVLVGLWDGKSNKVIRAGSGFIADKKRGLIVTAAHTLMNVWGDSKYPFGENYYGLQHGKVVIGVIPESGDDPSKKKDIAMFRYFAKIVAKDSSFDQGECHLDACVLQITTRMENDVGGNGEKCGVQPERLLINNEKAFYKENLKVLKISEECNLDDRVRILGFNQGGEGLLGPGERLNRFVDFARGYVCKKFSSSTEAESSGESSIPNISAGRTSRDCFQPREEIVVICPTIGGHSGGPCVNERGQVIGILSRADPAEKNRCYLSPTSEWLPLVKQAIKQAKKSSKGVPTAGL